MAGPAATNNNVIAGVGGKLQSPYGLLPFPPLHRQPPKITLQENKPGGNMLRGREMISSRKHVGET